MNEPAANLLKVLLIDDQAMIGEAVRRALADQSDIEFHYCGDSANAVAAVAEVKPTIILQDLVMPGIDGLALVRLYRADPATQDIPIIVLSTKEEPAVKSEAFTLGVNDYLIKLPDKIELVARIRSHSKAYLNLLQRNEAHRALAALNTELQRLSTVDGLTGLSNRTFFDEYFDREWRRAIREQSALGLLMIDVDNFKKHNDTFGHVAGDDVLRRVAAVVRKGVARPADLAARFGGEEFIVLLPNTGVEGACFVGEKIRREVEQLAIATEGGRHVTVSIGAAAMVPPQNRLAITLIEAADAALYRAKHEGKNRVLASAQT